MLVERNKELLHNPTFYGIDEPVALYFSYVDTESFEYYHKNKEQLVNISNTSQQKLVEYLKSLDYTAVSDDNWLAAHPGTIVVSKSGIQTPFIPPDRVEKFAYDLVCDIEKSRFAKPLSKILAIRLEQLPPPVLYPQTEKGVFSHLRHPDGRMLKFIQENYPSASIDALCREAFYLGEDIRPRLNKKPNIDDMSEDLYAGRRLALWMYSSYARNDLEARVGIFSTPFFNHAAKFRDKSARFQLIHVYEKSINQLYYDDYMIELGGDAQKEHDKQLETLAVPKVNPYRGLEIIVDGKSYMIPEDDEKWVVFKEYCRAAYLPNSEIMKQRRLNILNEAKQNGNVAKCYLAYGVDEKDLLLDNYLQKSDLELEDVLIEKPTPIRQEFNQYLCQSIDNMHNKVKQIKQSETQSTSKIHTELKIKQPKTPER